VIIINARLVPPVLPGVKTQGFLYCKREEEESCSIVGGLEESNESRWAFYIFFLFSFFLMEVPG
jgi:hypothetical protein